MGPLDRFTFPLPRPNIFPILSSPSSTSGQLPASAPPLLPSPSLFLPPPAPIAGAPPPASCFRVAQLVAAIFLLPFWDPYVFCIADVPKSGRCCREPTQPPRRHHCKLLAGAARERRRCCERLPPELQPGSCKRRRQSCKEHHRERLPPDLQGAGVGAAKGCRWCC